MVLAFSPPLGVGRSLDEELGFLHCYSRHAIHGLIHTVSVFALLHFMFSSFAYAPYIFSIAALFLYFSWDKSCSVVMALAAYGGLRFFAPVSASTLIILLLLTGISELHSIGRLLPLRNVKLLVFSLPFYAMMRLLWWTGHSWFMWERVIAYDALWSCKIRGKKVNNVWCVQYATSSNWNGQLTNRFDYTFVPETAQDVVNIVNWARNNGKKLRIRGQGHTTSPLLFSDTDSCLIDVRIMNAVRMDETAPPSAPRVVVSAGTCSHEMDSLLEPLGLCQPCNTVLSNFRVVGVVCTGCHGAGFEYDCISERVEWVKVVTSEGKIETISEESHGADVMGAMRCNLGALGVVLELALRVEPSTTWKITDELIPVEKMTRETLKDIFKRPGTTAELLFFPAAQEFWIKKCIQLPAGTPVHPYWKAYRTVQDLLTGTMSIPLRWAFNFVSHVPQFNLFPLYVRQHWKSNRQWLDMLAMTSVPVPTLGAVHYGNCLDRLSFELSEYLFKVDPDFGNLHSLLMSCTADIRTMLRAGEVPVTLVMEFRVNPASERTTLSPMYGKAGEFFCGLEWISLKGTPGYDEYVARMAKKLFDEYGARPHWAKKMILPNHELFPRIKKSFGQRIHSFENIRKRLDPHDMFLCDFLDRILH
eukprot:ANDGO_02169.mRNA.1 L-gulono-1